LEKEHNLTSSSGTDSTYSEYLEIIIQYGFVTLFGVAFPLAPALAFINNLIELQVDKYKFLELNRRPVPQSARSIGIWKDIISLVTTCAILQNAGIICFTANMFGQNSTDQFLTYIIIVMVVFFLIIGIKSLIPDISDSDAQAKKRHDFIIEQKIKGIVVEVEKSMEKEFTPHDVLFTKPYPPEDQKNLSEKKRKGEEHKVDEINIQMNSSEENQGPHDYENLLGQQKAQIEIKKKESSSSSSSSSKHKKSSDSGKESEEEMKLDLSSDFGKKKKDKNIANPGMKQKYLLEEGDNKE
jgi:hypothetical protein